MKGLKICEKVMLILTVLIFALSPVLPAIAAENSKTVTPSFYTMIVVSTVTPVIYFFTLSMIIPFFFTENKTLKSLSLAAFTTAIIINIVAISSCTNKSTDELGIGAILALVGVILGVITLIFYVVLNYIENSVDAEEKLVRELEKWNSLKEKNIINEDEFLAKKQEILKKYAK
ncbi:MAG: SHOCT domain-containing protein [Acholeplasmatales bacterium]|nr:SHOCT domain-containing protein [Acholeplasmatales bacterium]